MTNQDLAEFVIPTAYGLLDAAFDLGDLEVVVALSSWPHDHMHSSQPGLANLHRKIEPLAPQCALEDGLHLVPVFGVEAIAGNEHHARVEPAKALAAHEQAGLGAFLQIENSAGELQQFLGTGLEQLVPRQGLENVHQGLACVRAGPQAGHLQHPLDLDPNQRCVLAATNVGTGSEQTDDPLFATDPTLIVEPQDRDVIHIAIAVDSRATIGLGDDDRMDVATGTARVTRQLAELARLRSAVPGAHQSQTAGLDDDQHAIVA